MSDGSPRIAVVGGGAIGTSTLFHLVDRHDVEDAILFEKNQLGSGSTSKAAGGIRNTFTSELNVAMGRRNIDFFANFEDGVGRELEFRQTGYDYLFHSESAEADWRDRKAFFDGHGVASELRSPAETADLFPPLDPSAIGGSLLGTDCGHVDPHTLTQAFAGAAVDRGATVETKTEVRDVHTDDGGVTAVETEDDRYEVDYVVDAAGPWAGRVAKTVGLDVPLELLVRKIMVTSALETDADAPLFIDPELNCYFLPEQNGSLLVCDMDQDVHDVEDPDAVQSGEIGYDYYLDASEKLEQLVPAITELDVINGWAGLQTHTPDKHAIVGPTPVEGFLIACGFSGHGVQQSPSAGAALADLVATGETDVFDVSHLALERFDSDTQIEPEGMN